MTHFTSIYYRVGSDESLDCHAGVWTVRYLAIRSHSALTLPEFGTSWKCLGCYFVCTSNPESCTEEGSGATCRLELRFDASLQLLTCLVLMKQLELAKRHPAPVGVRAREKGVQGKHEYTTQPNACSRET